MVVPDMRIHCPGQSLILVPKFRNINFPCIKSSARIVRQSFRFPRIKNRAATEPNEIRSSRSDDGSVFQSFWSSLVEDIAWSLKMFLFFLAEQPNQLKHIEWPSFQSTVKTATLTLIIVACLIVALSSIDSALSFLLACFLRKSS